MPTENRKKKSKKDEKKPLISIKIESAELKPLEHYVDDRIELIKQIFGSLKSKTIESIIPEFLQVIFTHSVQFILIKLLHSNYSLLRGSQSKKFKRFVLKRFWVYQRNAYCQLSMQQNVHRTLNPPILVRMLKKLKVK